MDWASSGTMLTGSPSISMLPLDRKGRELRRRARPDWRRPTRLGAAGHARARSPGCAHRAIPRTRSTDLRAMAGEPRNGRHVAEDVLHAMVELGHQQALALLVALALGDVEDRPHHVQPLACRIGDGLAAVEQPADLSVWPHDLELDLATARFRRVAVDVLTDHVAVIGMDHGKRALQGQRLVALRCPPARADRGTSTPGRRQYGSRRCRSPRPRWPGARRSAVSRSWAGRRLELGGALLHAPLQLAVQALELARLAPQLGEDLDLGAQDLRNHGHRHVVDRAGLIAAHAVEIGQVDGGYEDDRRLLVARMVPQHPAPARSRRARACRRRSG